MPRGGKREGAGRKPGKVSAAKRELMDMAKDHAAEALAVLVSVMRDKGETGATRAGAATAILDRGYGRPRQMVEGPGPNGEHLVQTEDVTKRDADDFARQLSRLAEQRGAGSASGKADPGDTSGA